MTQRTDAPRVAIGVLTFHRPDRLGRLLPLLLAELDTRGSAADRVLVVDNDPAGSARPVVEATADPRVRYRLEPRPGISHARNAALDAATDHDLLVFIDDDESPAQDWLHHLVSSWRRFGAHAVAGRVVSRPDGELHPFVAAGDFLRRAHREGVATGTSLPRAATNNLLLDLAFVRSQGLRFDDRFGLTGGEDSLFTSQLVGAGGCLVWCAEAVVLDHVPADRMTPEYVLAKAAFMANSGIFVELALRRGSLARARFRIRTAIRELARTSQGLALLGRGTLLRSLRDRARGRRALARSSGALRAVGGHRTVQYAPVGPTGSRHDQEEGT